MTWSKPAIHNMIPLPRSLHSATTIGKRLVEKLAFTFLSCMAIFGVGSNPAQSLKIFSGLCSSSVMAAFALFIVMAIFV